MTGPTNRWQGLQTDDRAYKIYVIPNCVIKLNDYVISFIYSIQNDVSD
jgi:hypothetical protein